MYKKVEGEEKEEEEEEEEKPWGRFVTETSFNKRKNKKFTALKGSSLCPLVLLAKVESIVCPLLCSYS
jgi:hypothetical protein